MARLRAGEPKHGAETSMMRELTRVAAAACLIVTMACVNRVSDGAGRDSGVMSPERSAALAKQVESLAEKSDTTAIAATLKKECDDPATRSQCYETQLVPMASASKVKLAMGSLGQLAKLDSEVRTDGHVFAHAIGIAAGKQTQDVAAAFTQCSEAFQSGCYHGIIQAWFARLDTIRVKEANELCQPFRGSEAQRWIRFQCVHGMGHGLTMLHKHNLIKGLEGCDLLTDAWDRESCYGGAFMENIVNVTNPHHPAGALASEHEGHDMAGMDHAEAKPFKAVDPKDQLYPCSIVAAHYLRSCYEMQTSVMLHNNGGDMADAAKSCDRAPKDMRVVCYSSLGRDVSSWSQQKHPEAIRMCSVGQPKYQPWCFFGVVKNIIDINARPGEGIAFCRDVPGETNKLVCYAAVGEQIVILDPDEPDRRRMCADSETAYLDACLYGARVTLQPPPRLAQIWDSVR